MSVTSRRLLQRRPSCAFSWWKTNSNAPDRTSSVSGARPSRRIAPRPVDALISRPREHLNDERTGAPTVPVRGAGYMLAKPAS